MEIRTVRRPGEKGTRKLVEKYGERLICIRYRYDPVRRKRLKTVELVVAEEDWQPPEPHPQELKPAGLGPKAFYTHRVAIRLAYDEVDLRRQVKAVGGMWDPAERLWFVPEEYVRRLGLVQRVVKR